MQPFAIPCDSEEDLLFYSQYINQFYQFTSILIYLYLFVVLNFKVFFFSRADLLLTEQNLTVPTCSAYICFSVFNSVKCL